MRSAKAGAVALRRPPPVSGSEGGTEISWPPFCPIETLATFVAPPDTPFGGVDGAACHPPPKIGYFTPLAVRFPKNIVRFRVLRPCIDDDAR
jgi:hypothetical protein